MTTSSNRMGWLKAICKPAIRLPSTGRAARPAAMPITPAEASRLMPIWRTSGMVIRARLKPISPMLETARRVTTWVCVWMRRAIRLSLASVWWAITMAWPKPRAMRINSQVSEAISTMVVACRTRAMWAMSSGAPRSTNCKASSGSTMLAGLRAACATAEAGLDCAVPRLTMAAPLKKISQARAMATAAERKVRVQGDRFKSIGPPQQSAYPWRFLGRPQGPISARFRGYIQGNA